MLVERAFVDVLLVALARAETEVLLALRAHCHNACELLFEQHLPAVVTQRSQLRGVVVRFATERHPQSHLASSSRYQQRPTTPGPARAPMTGPASAIQCSTQ